jgi:uncharacterized protein
MQTNEEGGRIAAIDVLRGAAVLGILLMNIQSFSMISSAYMNPTAYGDLSSFNAWIWAFCRLFADQKFMTLFSMLFGAGIVLMSERTAARGRRPWAAHYRRMAVLLAVGLAHGILLWHGDILTVYAVCGMLIYCARKWRPSILFVLGILCVLVGAGVLVNFQLSTKDFSPEGMAELEDVWNASEETAEWELEVFRGTYREQLEARTGESGKFYDMMLWVWFARVTGLMLMGMAVFKWKVLHAERSVAFYRRMLVIGLGIGLAVEAIGIVYQNRGEWSVDVMVPGLLFNYFASLFTAAGYLAAVMLIHLREWWPAAQAKLAAVGRMAFTNYLAQTIICTTIFYGHGLGLFGYVERWQQLLIVLAIWAAQIAWSNWWLQRFQTGPLEWLWRSATYLRIVPLRREI